MSNAPWNRLQGQIWLGDAVFLKRMALSAYGMADEKRLRSRGHQEAFQGGSIYCGVANLLLLAVAKRSGVSPSRISKIQRTIEIANPPVVLRQLLDKCNVKN